MQITISELRQLVREVLSEQKRVSKAYGGKAYGASPGSVSSIKKSDDSAKKAVGAGKFDWAKDPWAAAQAAHIVATGEPTVKKGTKRKATEVAGKKEEAKTCDGCGTRCEEGKACKECGWMG